MENPQQYIIEELKKSTVKKVERATGIPADRMYKWLAGKGTPKTEDMNTLLAFFKIGTNSDYTEDDNSNLLAEPIVNYNRSGVPYYDINFVNGFNDVIKGKIDTTFFIDFQPLNDVDYWVNVSDSNTLPLIDNGDIVALKKVDNWESFLLEDELYAIITNNDFIAIRIVSSGKDDKHFTLHKNKTDKNNGQSIPKEIITHVFRVKGSIKKFF